MRKYVGGKFEGIFGVCPFTPRKETTSHCKEVRKHAVRTI